MTAAISVNHFLASLSVKDASLLECHLKHAELPKGSVLFRNGEFIERILFPFAGAVSVLVRFSGGQTVAVGLIGRNGVVGGDAAIDGQIAINYAVVQNSVTGVFVSAATLRRLADQSVSLRTALVRWNEMALAQTQQIAACNAVHGLEQRLCRWLARTHDLVNSEPFEFTHDLLSQMLGAQRSSITEIAQHLHDQGIINYRRGLIDIRDVEGLRRLACECYLAINEQFERLVGWKPSIGK